MNSRRPRFLAAVTMLAAVAAAALLAASPANASPTTHAVTTANGVTTITFTRKATPGHAMPAAGGTITCSIRASGLYLLQPGATWGPYIADYTNDDIGDTSWVTCTAPVQQIRLQTTLVYNGAYYSGTYWWSNNSATVLPSHQRPSVRRRPGLVPACRHEAAGPLLLRHSS
jgi:hypothetical protein